MSKPEYQEIALFKLRPSPSNPRKTFDELSLKELAESIRAEDVLQPIMVRTLEEDIYEIVCGERRYRASKLAEKETIPAMVRELTDEQVLEIQITENLQRQDVAPLEEAEGFKNLLALKGHYTAEELAKRVGKSATYIYQRLKLNELIPAAKELLQKDILSISHCLHLSRLPEESQIRALEHISYADGEESEITSVDSVADLKQFITSKILLDLNKAAFDKEDKKLGLACGSCLECPKRTGFNKTLFPDIESDDICMDATCFMQKKTANFHKQLSIAIKKKKPLVQITEGYRSVGEDVLNRNDYTFCEGEFENTETAIIVDDAKLGQIEYIRRQAKFTTEETQEQKLEREKEELEDEIKEQAAVRLKEKIQYGVNSKEILHATLIHTILIFITTFRGVDILFDIIKSYVPITLPDESEELDEYNDDHQEAVIKALMTCETDTLQTIIRQMLITNLGKVILPTYYYYLLISPEDIEAEVRAELTPSPEPVKEKKGKAKKK